MAEKISQKKALVTVTLMRFLFLSCHGVVQTFSVCLLWYLSLPKASRRPRQKKYIKVKQN